MTVDRGPYYRELIEVGLLTLVVTRTREIGGLYVATLWRVRASASTILHLLANPGRAN